MFNKQCRIRVSFNDGHLKCWTCHGAVICKVRYDLICNEINKKNNGIVDGCDSDLFILYTLFIIL